MIAVKIRSIRKERKFSGTQIAECLGITPQFYYDIEKGKRRLTAETAIKLAQIFDVSLDHLLDQEDASHEPEPSAAREAKTMFSHRFKELRVKYGFTQDDMQDKLGMNRANISNYERGMALPPVDTLMQIADIFNVSTDHLLGRRTPDAVDIAVIEAKRLQNILRRIKAMVLEETI